MPDCLCLWSCSLFGLLATAWILSFASRQTESNEKYQLSFPLVMEKPVRRCSKIPNFSNLQGKQKLAGKIGFCPCVPIHKSWYKIPNNTQQVPNDSYTKKEQWLFPCLPVHQDRIKNGVKYPFLFHQCNRCLPFLPFYTVEPRLTTTPLIRPPRYYGHFILAWKKAQSVIFLFKEPL